MDPLSGGASRRSQPSWSLEGWRWEELEIVGTFSQFFSWQVWTSPFFRSGGEIKMKVEDKT